MNEWPAGWYQDDSAGRAGSGGAASQADPTVHLPGGGGSAGAAPGGWPSQPPQQGGMGQGAWAPARPRGMGRPPRLPGRGWGQRRIFRILALVVAALLIVTVGMYFYLDGKLIRAKALVPTSNVSSGTNWLISGAPGKVSTRQARRLHTGLAPDSNSDTIMLLHIPANGGAPVLVSIPRDSYVPIPGNGMNKINAAYTFGGARLLVQTVQNVTGLTVNHYINIGYIGLVNAVNAVGGVRICLPSALHDQASGVKLPKGCDNLDGKEALAFVRTRHQFLTQDLQREQNQRVFMKALLSKMLSPGTLLNPFAIIPASVGSAGALTVDRGTHLYQLLGFMLALRHPKTTTVPIANANYYTPAGDAVQWNRPEALRLFNDLRTDQPVPKSLLTGSKLG